jgi:hypothetical protein
MRTPASGRFKCMLAHEEWYIFYFLNMFLKAGALPLTLIICNGQKCNSFKNG